MPPTAVLDLAVADIATNRVALLVEKGKILELQPAESHVRSAHAELAAGGADHVKLPVGLVTAEGPGLNQSVLDLRSYQVMSYFSLPLLSVSGRTRQPPGDGRNRLPHALPRAQVTALDDCRDADAGISRGSDGILPDRVLQSRVLNASGTGSRPSSSRQSRDHSRTSSLNCSEDCNVTSSLW